MKKSIDTPFSSSVCAGASRTEPMPARQLHNRSGMVDTMSDNKQYKKQRKKIRKIRKSSVLSSTISLLLTSVIVAGFIVIFAATFLSYMIDTKFADEYRALKYMSSLYEDGMLDRFGNLYHDVNDQERMYIITDADGNILETHGEDTRAENSSTTTLAQIRQDVEVYEDRVYNYIIVGEQSLSFRGSVIMDAIHVAASDEDETYNVGFVTGSGYDPNAMSVTTPAMEPIIMPLWMVIDIDGGAKKFIGRAVFGVTQRDVGMFGLIVIVTIILFIGIFTAIFVSMIKNARRQRVLMNMFFNDEVTGGHNWSWFVTKGQMLMYKNRKAKYKYAIVNLVFVNYRNYCVCHSVSEGEIFLKKVYEHITGYIGKKDLCAHCTPSNFALIIKYDSEAELKSRLTKLVNDLSTMDSDHRFCFQAGVELTDRVFHEEGSELPRELDLDHQYNNACAARMSLGDSEESGVAYFDESLIEDQKWIDKVQEHQQKALENNEFLVYYQPKYDPVTETLKGAEALVRWDSPDLGFVSPGKFIPIFEKNGFITNIDHYMIEHVAKDQKAWLDAGYTCVPVSVNVSRAHFIESDLAEQIRDIVDSAGTPHEYVEIELTESAFFDDKKAMLTTINKLKGYGFAVSMDDFGSGYSSLNSLKDMPLDVLKLDAEFFRGESEDKRAKIVVAEAIKLAKNLNMRTVAEGVEVKEQVEFLGAEGCDMIQGYYFSKPVTHDEYEAKMKRDNTDE